MPRLSTSTLFPYTTLFRSGLETGSGVERVFDRQLEPRHGNLDVRIDGIGKIGEDVHAGLELLGRCRRRRQDRKSTRLNSSHVKISYAVFCLKKKNKNRV